MVRSIARRPPVRNWVASLATAAYLGWLIAAQHESVAPVLASVAIAAIWSWWFACRRAPGSSYTAFLAESWDVHILGLALLLGLVYQQRVTEGITSDGCLYFAHLRSLVFDRDLEIGSELAVLRLPPRPHHTVSIGAAIVWAPIYLIVFAIDALGQAAGSWTAPRHVLPGLTGAYARAALVSSYVVAAAGLAALHIHLRRTFDRMTMLCASLLAFAATPVVWYAVYEPAMTHAASFGLAALFVAGSAAWIPARPLSIGRGLTLGALFGLMVVIRPQDGLFGIFPLVFACDAAGWRLARLGEPMRVLLLIAAGAAPLIALELAFTVALLAAQPVRLVGKGGYLHLLDSHWLDALFSSRHGFFSWTPIAYIAFLGTFFYFRRNRSWTIAALVVFAAMCWINGSADDWWGGWAFGGRRFASTVAALLPGLAVVLTPIRRRGSALVMPLTVLAIAWNAGLMSQYHYGDLPRDAPVSFSTMISQQADILSHPPRFYPFAFPANAWFAWREGVPIDRYDLLGPIRLMPRTELTLDRDATPFLLDGWEWMENTPPDGGEWRARGPDASLVLPLDPPAAPSIALEIDAQLAASSDGPPTGLAVQVNRVHMGRATIGSDMRTIRFDTGSVAANHRVWRKGYNRLTFRIGDRSSIVVHAIRAVPHPIGQPF